MQVKFILVSLLIIQYLDPLSAIVKRHRSTVKSVQPSPLSMRKSQNKSQRFASSSTKQNSKRSRKANLYAPVGYNRGDFTNLLTMFNENSNSGVLSYDSFLESRYLR